jgi:hypothetical protein
MQVNNQVPMRKLFIHAANILLLFVLVVLAAPQPPADAAKAAPTEQSCHEFVQEFYNWYLAGFRKQTDGITIQTVFKERGSSFTPTLRQQLEIDAKAAAANPGEVVGLDFDPFLNAQDTPERCIFGKVTPKANNYSVEVFEVFSGKKSQKPDVVPELEFKNGQWVFTNFVYPRDKGKSDDLLNVLKNLAADRAKLSQESAHHNR